MTARQHRFITEYLVDLNATQAAVRAGYSRRTANRIASENLSKPDIRAHVNKEMDDRARRTEITLDNVVKELAIIAFSNAHAGADGGVSRIRTADKLRALELLGKHLGMFREREESPATAAVTIDASKIAALTDEELQRGIANLDVLLSAVANKDSAAA
jgi:phage terminase small subunit